MRRLRSWALRLSGVFARARRDRELADEFASHLEMQIDENVRRGLAPDAARREALIKAGGITAATDAYRDQRGLPVIEHVIHDVRYALRLLRRSPAFAITAVVSLALGIGANTALFSLTNAVLLATLPVRNPGELVLFRWIASDGALSGSIDGSITRDDATGLKTSTSFSYPAFSRLHEKGQTLASVFGFAPVEQLNVVAGDDAQIAHGQLVTGDYFAGLGVSAARGRTIMPDDDRADAPRVAVISYAYWQRRFGLDSTVVGKRLAVNGQPVVVIGVTPPGFAGALQVGESADITLALSPEPSRRRDLSNPRSWWLRVMARRAPGATAAQVAAELDAPFRAAALESMAGQTSSLADGKKETPPRLIVDPGERGLTELRDAYRRPLVILTAVLGLVLLLACVNVATLLLSRGAARDREMTVRLAVGANRARLVRQLLTESILIALMAATLGLALAFAGRNVLFALRPWGGVALDLHLALDGRALAFTIVAAVTTGVLFGVAPALRATRVNLTESLKDSAKNAGGAAHSRLAQGLVVAQVAMCVMLLIVAGLFVRTLHNLRTVDVGWNPNGLLLFRIDPRLSGYERDRVAALYEQLLAEIGRVPGVRAVTFSRHPQLSDSRRSDGLFVRGRPAPVGIRRETAINPVGPRFFETMQLPIVLGRAIGSRDNAKAPKVAVINEALAHAYFGTENPIGGHLGFGDDSVGGVEIVGVAKDAHYYSIRRPVEPIVYMPYYQTDAGQANISVRMSGDVAAVTAGIRAAVRDVDKNLPMFDVRTQQDAAEGTITQELLFARLSGFFSILAVLLACLGVYGVMSYSTTQRSAEIGIRMALGAQSGDIVRLVMTRALVMVTAGLVLGTLAAIAVTRVVANLMYGLSTTDPLTIAGTIVAMLAVTGIAGYLPARRAKGVSPLTMLRSAG